MSRFRVFSIRAAPRIFVLGLAASALALSAIAQQTTSYVFLMGSGLVCESDNYACPAAAKNAEGESYELTGTGSFDPKMKLAQATGSFTHRSAHGDVLERGVWIASEFVRFDSYGLAPSTLLRNAMPRGFGPFGLKRGGIPSRPMAIGGLAVLRIRLLSLSGPPTTARLEMNCAIGHVPSDRSVEGIRLIVEKNGAEFSEEAVGRVLFLPISAQMGVSSRTVQHEVDAEGAGPQRQ